MLALLWKHLKWPGLRILYLNTEMLVPLTLRSHKPWSAHWSVSGDIVQKMACFQLCVVLLHVLSRTKQGLTRLCSFKKTLSSKYGKTLKLFFLFPQLQYYWPWWQEKLLASWRTLVMMWLLAGAWPFSKGFLVAVQYHRYVSEWTSRDSAYNWTEVCL